MKSIKITFLVVAICSALASAVFVVNFESIVNNIGTFFTKAYAIVFMLLAVATTKEVVSLDITEDE